MVSLLNISLIGFFLFIIVIIQAQPLLKISNDIDENKSSINNQNQLYELYKIMRTDPRLASVSNHDIVSYIYRNFVLGSGNDIDLSQPKQQTYRRHRYQQTN